MSQAGETGEGAEVVHLAALEVEASEVGHPGHEVHASVERSLGRCRLHVVVGEVERCQCPRAGIQEGSKGADLVKSAEGGDAEVFESCACSQTADGLGR